MIVTLAAIIPWGILLILFPRHTAVFWMWVMQDPRSAVLVGAVYAGASIYLLLALRHDDWPQTRMGLEGSLTVSLTLLVMAILHYGIIRAWHPMTLVWLPGYYAPVFLIPILFKDQVDRNVTGPGEREISPLAASFLTVRSLLYLAAAVGLFVFAEPLGRAWPWRIDPIEIRMFAAQPATFLWSAVAVRRGNRAWRWHRLPMFYVLTLGIVQLVGLSLIRTPYDWSSAVGLLLALSFIEWVVTPLVMLRRYGAVELAASPKGPERRAPQGLRPAAVQYGAQLVGAAYLAFGLIGFIPSDAVNPYHAEGVGARYLLGFLAINPLHNMVHIAVGLSGLWAARNVHTARRWAQTASVVLLALFVAGMVHGWSAGFPPNHSLFGLVAINSAGHVFHVATGLVGLVLGLSTLRPASAP